MVLSGCPQSGGQAADGRRHHVFCPLAALDCDAVDRHTFAPLDATSLGARCGADPVRRLSGVRHPCGLDRVARQPAESLATGMAAPAAARAPRHPARLDGAGAGRPWVWARWLFGRIVGLGWHPLLRINNGAKFQPVGHARWYWLHELGALSARAGEAGARRSSRQRGVWICTLVAWWGDGYTDPWFLLTAWSLKAATRPGIACGVGVSRALNVSSGVGGSGNIRTCMPPSGLPASGWPWPSPPCGWSAWAVRWKSSRCPQAGEVPAATAVGGYGDDARSAALPPADAPAGCGAWSARSPQEGCPCPSASSPSLGLRCP